MSYCNIVCVQFKYFVEKNVDVRRSMYTHNNEYILNSRYILLKNIERMNIRVFMVLLCSYLSCFTVNYSLWFVRIFIFILMHAD